MRVSFDLIKYKIIPDISDPFDLLELSHTCKTLRNYIHSIKRKCLNPDCENKNCNYGDFKVFLKVLNIISGIEPIDYSILYYKCIVYQLRFILFPYKKRFTLSYREQKYQEGSNIFPSVGLSYRRYDFLTFDRIEHKNENINNLWKIDTFDSLLLMQNMSDLWSKEHKDEYRKNIFVSGVWCREGYYEVKLKKSITIYLALLTTKYLI
jgi:hypothetical protein